MKADEGRSRSRARSSGQKRTSTTPKEEHGLSDETTRPEDEVEAHGPTFGSPTMGGPELEGPEMEATDEEPDVEAHGPVFDSPTAEVVVDSPTAE